MAISKIPEEVHPAFNETEVVETSDTSLTVEEMEPLNRSITLSRVQIDNQTRFNIRNFVSSLFYNQQTAKLTKGVGGWIFNDYNLFVKYRIGSYEFFALNAVRRRGESLDLINQGPDALLTRRERIESTEGTSVEIPKYPGYPVGVSTLFKSMYGPDYTGAVGMTFQVTSGMSITLPWTALGSSERYEVIDWGDGQIVSGYNISKTHQYRVSGLVTVYWWPNGQYLIGYSPISTYNTAVRSVFNLPDFAGSSLTFTNMTGLTSFTATLPTATLLNTVQYGILSGCTSLTTVGADLYTRNGGDNFIIVTGGGTVTTSAFSGCTSLRTIPSSLMDPIRNACTTVSSMFEGCTVLTNLPNTFWGNMPKCEIVDSAFRGCATMTSVPTCSGMPALVNARRYCQDMTRLTAAGIPADLFANSPNLTLITYLFYNCTALTGISGNIFNSAIAGKVTDLLYFFGNQTTGGITAIPTWFNTFWTALTTVQYCYSNTRITSLPDRIFPNCPNLTDMRYIFENCQIASFPSTLFSGKTGTLDLRGLCKGNTSGAVLPANLFTGVTITNTYEFFYRSNVTFPVSIFYGQNITDAGRMFLTYTGGNLPGDIFRDSVGLSSIIYFSGLDNTVNSGANWTSIPSNLFENCPNLRSVNQAFSRNLFLSSATPVTPGGYKMWERDKEPGYLLPTGYANYLSYATNSPDYGIAPTGWK